MKHRASILATILFLVVGLPRPGLAQDQGARAKADLAPLAACLQQQTESLPQTRPDSVPVPEQPRKQFPDQSGQPVNEDDPQESSMLSITGTIMKEHGKYVLKAWDKRTYQIDDQDQNKAKKYEGELVKIVGSLEPRTNSIRIQRIELKS
jgi:hypothetical protein